MKKSSVLIILFLFLISGRSLSINWDEAKTLMQSKSNELESARKQLESSEWSYKRSFSAFLPQLSGSASMREDMISASKTYSYGLSATQYLFKGMAGIYGIQSAYNDLEYYKAGFMNTEAEVFYDLRSAFVELFVAQEKVNFWKKYSKNAKKIPG